MQRHTNMLVSDGVRLLSFVPSQSWKLEYHFEDYAYFSIIVGADNNVES